MKKVIKHAPPPRYLTYSEHGLKTALSNAGKNVAAGKDPKNFLRIAKEERAKVELETLLRNQPRATLNRVSN
jgi:hypothetical protein